MAKPSTRESEEILACNPLDALEAARMHVGRVDLSPCERARAWEDFAQACRVLGDYCRADTCYQRAQELCTCQECLPRRCRRISYLRVHQGDYREALREAEKALAIARSHQELGRAEVALAYVHAHLGDPTLAVHTARLALGHLASADHVWAGSALGSLVLAALKKEAVADEVLRELAADLRQVSKGWPRAEQWQGHRARVKMILALIRDRLGTIRPAELRDTLQEVQSTLIELGLIRGALEITAETAELCAEMRREELVGRTLLAMLDALPKALPRHIAGALRTLRQSIDAIDRGEMRRAGAELRAALALRPSPAV